MSDIFDPFQYTKDLREHPENYFSMAQVVQQATTLRKIRHAATVKALHEAFQAPAKLAKADGDIELLGLLTEAAKKRKIELAKEN